MLKDVDSKKVAYLIGYLAGDGNFCNGWGKRKDRLSVTTVDVEFVKWVSENIVDFPMTNPKLNHNKERGIFAKQKSYTKTFPVSYSEDLKRYGVLSLKKDRSIQNISKKDMQHWLRGFMDSDGHISYSIRKDRDRLAGKAGFTHPSDKLLGQVQKFLMDELNIPSAIKPKKGEDCFTLSFSKLSDVKKFGMFIYGGGKDVVLTRKYKTFKEMCDILEERVEAGISYPREFTITKVYGEYIGSFSNSMFIDPEGREFPSAKLASDKHGVDKKTLRSWSDNNRKGWSKRPKTEHEKEEYKKYVTRQIKKAFKEWRDENPDFY